MKSPSAAAQGTNPARPGPGAAQRASRAPTQQQDAALGMAAVPELSAELLAASKAAELSPPGCQEETCTKISCGFSTFLELSAPRAPALRVWVPDCRDEATRRQPEVSLL